MNKSESDNIFRVIFQQSFDAIFIETMDGEILHSNDTACKLYGYTKEELLKMNAIDLVPARQKTCVEAVAANVVQNAGREINILAEALGQRKDGSLFPTEVAITAIEYSGQNCLAVAVRNVAERKASKVASEKYECQIQQIQKLDTLGMIATGLSNDFNNLLTGVMGYSDLIKRDVGDFPSVIEKANKIIEASRKAGELIQQLMIYAGDKKSKMKMVDLQAIIAETYHMASKQLKAGKSLDLKITETIPDIFADGFQVKQAILNLLKNACEAMTQKIGKILISVSIGSRNFSGVETGYFGSPMQAGEYVEICISDDGCGMTPEQTERAFEAFYSGKSNKRGLGLTAVLNMVKQHRGAVRLRSNTKKGTEISLLLPCALQDQPSSIAKVNKYREDNYPAGLALIIDDEISIRELMCTFLEQLGYKAICAKNGVDGIKLFKKYVRQLKVVILDVVMPSIDGIDVLKELKWLNPEIPIIVCSGIRLKELKLTLKEHGVRLFLEKPFELEELEEALLKLQIQKNISNF